MFTEQLSIVLAFVLDVLAKATLLLLAVALLDVLLRRQSAALRHRLWAISFISLMLLPVLAKITPEYRLAVFPASWVDDNSFARTVVESPLIGSSISPASTLPTNSPESFGSPSASAFSTDDPQLSTDEPFRMGADELRQSTFAPIATTSPSPELELSSHSPISRWLSISFGAIWCIGLLLSFIPLLVGCIRNAALRRASVGISESALTDMRDEYCGRLGITRYVRLLEARRAIVPMTWGVLHPVVLLPHNWRAWGDECRQLVLLHELAHVKRLDVVYQTLARVTCTMYWFHPLVWYALRRLRVERELACDDCVLMTGARPSLYAEQLLTIAREYQSLALPPAVAMAQKSGLEQRLRALLDKARSHVPLSRRAGGALIVCSLVAATLLAVIRLDAQETGQADNTTAAGPTPTGDAEATPKLNIHGQVLGPDNKPIADAEVVALRAFQANVSWNYSYETLASTRTDAQGQYRLQVPARSARFSDGLHLEQQHTIVVAKREGFGPDAARVEDDATETQLQLAKATVPIEGQIVDLEGRPVAGVRVRIESIDKPASPVDEWLETAKQNPAKLSKQMMMAPPAGNPNRPTVAHFPSYERIRAVEAIALPTVTTDAQGRFRLSGLGDDRRVILRIDSPRIATVRLHAVTRDMPDVNTPSLDPKERSGKTFGANFVYSAEPSQLIRGQVRDKKSGQPLAGVRIELSQYADQFLGLHNWLTTTTDAEGRFELHGVPKPAADAERATRIAVYPAKDQAYFRCFQFVPQQAGLAPIDLDIELTPAIWATGKVTDSKTAEPVPAMVAYHPYLDNPYAADHEAWDRGLHTMGYEDLVATDADGNFRVPALPGRGILRVVAANDTEFALENDRPAEQPAGLIIDGAGNIGTAFDRSRGAEKKLFHVGMPGNARIELDLPADARRVDIDATVQRLDSIVVEARDTSGNPVHGFLLAGRTPIDRLTISGRGVNYWQTQPNRSAQAKIFLGAEKESHRPIMFFHPQLETGAIVWLEQLIQQKQNPHPVTLEPCATITGRLVDGAGKPLQIGYLQAGVGDVSQINAMFSFADGNVVRQSGHIRFRVQDGCSLDKDGRFEYLVPPGEAYSLILGNSTADTVLFSDLTIRPGTTIDLGQVDVTAAPEARPEIKVTGVDQAGRDTSTASTTAEPGSSIESTSEHVNISGIVTGPDDATIASARVAVVRVFHAHNSPSPISYQLLVETITDDEGRFAVDVPAKSARFSNGHLFEDQHTRVVASKVGFGMDEVVVDPTAELTQLRMARATQAIQGKLVDLEGRPLAGVTVHLTQIDKPAKPLEGWLLEAADNPISLADSPLMQSIKTGRLPPGNQQAPKVAYFPTQDQIVAVDVFGPIEVSTDANGLFSIGGIGDDRQAILQIAAPDIATVWLQAVTREMPAVNAPNFDPRFRAGKIFGSQFVYSAEPAQWIRGTARDRHSGAPLAGVKVSMSQFADNTFGVQGIAHCMTDADGKYTLTGIPKAPQTSRGIRLRIEPARNQPYFRHDKMVPKTAGLEPIELDLELTQGIWIEGQVTDAVTGEAVPGLVAYYPYRDNPLAEDHEAWQSGLMTIGYGDMVATDTDGRFRIPGMTGHGVLRVVAQKDQVYEMVPGSDVNAHMSQMRRTYYHIGFPGNAMAEMHIADSVETHHVDVVLNPLPLRQLHVVDADGRDVTGFSMAGRMPVGRHYASGRGGSYWDQSLTETALTKIYPGEGSELQRPLMFFHSQRKLGAVVSLEEVASNPQADVQISLLPCATVTGSLSDKQGPLVAGYVQGGVGLEDRQSFSSGGGSNTKTIALKYPVQHVERLENLGSFEYVVPACERFSLVYKGSDQNAVLLRDIELKPGQCLDLGRIDLSKDPQAWPKPKQVSPNG